MIFPWAPALTDTRPSRAAAEQLLDLLDDRPRTAAELRALLAQRGIKRSSAVIRNALTQLANAGHVSRERVGKRFVYRRAWPGPETVRRRMTASEAGALRAVVVCDGLLAHATGEPLGSRRPGVRRACDFHRFTLERLSELGCLQLQRRGRRHRWTPTNLGRAVAELGR